MLFPTLDLTPSSKAYRPVELWTTAGDFGEDDGRVSGQLEAIVSSDGLPSLDWDGGAEIGDEEEKDDYKQLSFREYPLCSTLIQILF